MARYAPAREDGLKPYVVATPDGQRVVVFGRDVHDACERHREADGRRIAGAWRATSDDMAAHPEPKDK